MKKKPTGDFLTKKARTKPETGSGTEQSIRDSKPGEGSQGILDKIPEGVILTNAHGRIRYLNKQAKELFGERAETYEDNEGPHNFGLYLDDGRMLYPEDELPFIRALQGETTHAEEMMLRKNEEDEGIWISMTSYPLSSMGNAVDGAISFIRNINYRKQIELSQDTLVRKTEALYKLSHIIAEAGNNIKILSQSVAKFTSETIGDLCVVFSNNIESSQIEIVAYSDTNPTGNTLMRKLAAHSIRIDGDNSIAGGVIKSGEPLLIPSIHPEKTKAITFPEFEEIIDKVGLVSLLTVPLLGRSGVLGAISVFRHSGGKSFKLDDQTFLMDIAHRTALAIENCRLFESLRIEIAERLSTEQKLDTSEGRFRAIFESTTLGIKVLDLDGNILQTNAAFQKMLGYSEVELVGRHFSDFLFRADLPQALNLIQNLRVTGATQFLFEHRTVQKDETVVWVKTTFSPVKKNNGNGKPAYIVGIVENINEQMQTEQEMKELRDRLQDNIEKERLKLAQELHDNPMQILHNVMYSLEELRSLADQQLADKLVQISSEVQSVLDGLRATTKELRPPTIFDFGLENAIRSYTEDFLEKHPELSVSLSLARDRQLIPEEVRLALFRIFQQAMMNIIRHSEATEIKVRFAFDVENVYLEISDNGKGFAVPSNWIEFAREGHFGLAGAAERASSFGGAFEVESIPGNTTTIKVSIPRQEAQ